jgi:hypothetical protein
MPGRYRGKGETLAPEQEFRCDLRPNSLALVAIGGSRGDRSALYRYRTGGIASGSSAFQDPRSHAQCLDLSLKARNLCLKNGDLVLFFLDRVVDVGHLLRPFRSRIYQR